MTNKKYHRLGELEEDYGLEPIKVLRECADKNKYLLAYLDLNGIKLETRSNKKCSDYSFIGKECLYYFCQTDIKKSVHKNFYEIEISCLYLHEEPRTGYRDEEGNDLPQNKSPTKWILDEEIYFKDKSYKLNVPINNVEISIDRLRNLKCCPTELIKYHYRKLQRLDRLADDIYYVIEELDMEGRVCSPSEIWDRLQQRVGKSGSCCVDIVPDPDPDSKSVLIKWFNIPGKAQHLSFPKLKRRLERMRD